MPSPAVRSLVTMAYVHDVTRSIAFYERLGFRAGNTFAPPGADGPVWAWLETGDARIMLAQADEPVVPEQQAVLFYLYYDDVPATRSALAQSGVPTGPIEYPFYAPRGQFRVRDPDGYALMITHV